MLARFGCSIERSRNVLDTFFSKKYQHNDENKKTEVADNQRLPFFQSSQKFLKFGMTHV